MKTKEMTKRVIEPTTENTQVVQQWFADLPPEQQFAFKGYGKIVNIDADLSHDPLDIPCLLNSSEKSDLVIGSRYFNGVRVMNWDPKRLLLSLLAAN